MPAGQRDNWLGTSTRSGGGGGGGVSAAPVAPVGTQAEFGKLRQQDEIDDLRLLAPAIGYNVLTYWWRG